MDSTAHISDQHLDKLMLRIAGNDSFKEYLPEISSDLPLEARVRAIKSIPALSTVLDSCVDYFDFKFKKMIVSDNDFKLTLVVRGGVSKIFNYYDIHFVPNPEAFEERLEQLEENRKEVESRPSLLKEDKFEIKEIEKAVAQSEQAMSKFLDANPNFWGTVKVSSWKEAQLSGFEITFRNLSMDMARRILEQHEDLDSNYRIVLNPLISGDRYQEKMKQETIEKVEEEEETEDETND